MANWQNALRRIKLKMLLRNKSCGSNSPVGRFSHMDLAHKFRHSGAVRNPRVYPLAEFSGFSSKCRWTEFLLTFIEFAEIHLDSGLRRNDGTVKTRRHLCDAQ